MNSTIFDDGVITVTESEVRAKGFTLYVDTISSISISSVRPMKWVGLIMAIPIGMGLLFMTFMNRLLGSLWGQPSAMVYILPLFCFLPLCLLAVGAFFARFSRLWLQTTGAPVLVASHFSFSDQYETIEHYKAIKAAIEQAISMSKTRSSSVAH